MLDQYAMWIGYGVMAAGGMLLMCLALIVAIGGIGSLGKKLGHQLAAPHDVRTLQAHLMLLDQQGKTWTKGKNDHA